MIKILLFFSFFLTMNQLAASNVEIKIKDGLLISGDFIGTYMNYVHVLQDNSVEYFDCDEIESILLVNTKELLTYDCNTNSVSEEILFPPELDPMTGEWITIIPEVFKKIKQGEQNKKVEGSLKEIEPEVVEQKLLEEEEKLFKRKIALSDEGFDDLMLWADKKENNIQKTNSNSNFILDPSGLKNRINKAEEPHYLTKSEIQILIKEELQKHLHPKTREKNKEQSLYERYKSGSITENELNRIVDGRSPVELLEANLITQDEYNKNPKKITNPISYMEKYGLVNTMTKKPEFIILPACGVYVFLVFLFG